MQKMIVIIMTPQHEVSYRPSLLYHVGFYHMI